MYTVLFCILAAASQAETYEFRVDIADVVELPCGDCDGVALGDINASGKMDILASSGSYGDVFWFEQGQDPAQWTKRMIYSMGVDTGEFEGNDLADFDGDGRLEAVSLDQPNGRILLHKFTDPDAHQWETAVIQSQRPLVQASLVTDFTGDGTLELVYTWEGREEGAGGVHLLQFVGDDVLNPEHWRDHVLMQHESAWWLVPRRLDMSGNGQETDIVYTARRMPRRNPGTRPGLYWLEITDGLEGPITRHVIDETLPHPLQVDVGDLSGAGHDLDLVVGGFDTDIIYWFERSQDWQRHEIPLPAEVNDVTPDRVWNIKPIPVPGSRDALLAPITGNGRGALMCFEYIDGAYRPNVLMLLDYTHPMDDRVILHDLTGNGIPEAIIPDSGPGIDRLLIIQFSIAPAPEEGR